VDVKWKILYSIREFFQDNGVIAKGGEIRPSCRERLLCDFRVAALQFLFMLG